MFKRSILIFAILLFGLIGCTPPAHLGLWKEIGRSECATADITKAQNLFIGVEELIFEGNGRFIFSWNKFEEHWSDYWGTYQLDSDTGQVSFTIEGGNMLPDEFDLEGNFSFDDQGRLVFDNIWFGSHPHADPHPQPCSYIFDKSH